MSVVNLSFKLLVLLALILNGTAVHGLVMLIDPADGLSDAHWGSADCHSAAGHGDSAPAAPPGAGTDSGGNDPMEHDCGGSGCTCPCANHTPPLALAAIIPGSLSVPSRVLPRSYTSFHSLTPPPLLRPPIA